MGALSASSSASMVPIEVSITMGILPVSAGPEGSGGAAGAFASGAFTGAAAFSAGGAHPARLNRPIARARGRVFVRVLMMKRVFRLPDYRGRLTGAAARGRQ